MYYYYPNAYDLDVWSNVAILEYEMATVQYSHKAVTNGDSWPSVANSIQPRKLRVLFFRKRKVGLRLARDRGYVESTI